jgi:hypothetical protein
MALEKWTVFFNVEDQGSIPPPTFAAGTIEVPSGGKNKAVGYGGMICGVQQPVDCKAAIVEAEGAEEAILAVRQVIKQAEGTAMACKTSSLTEVT